MTQAHWLCFILLWCCSAHSAASSRSSRNRSSRSEAAIASAQVCRIKFGTSQLNHKVVSRWRQLQADERERDVTRVDSALLPDYWSKPREVGDAIDPRIRTNGDAPEQLVKVTDRRHRHPVFATICSIGFLLTIIGIIVICTH